jgi:hypothetical protein
LKVIGADVRYMYQSENLTVDEIEEYNGDGEGDGDASTPLSSSSPSTKTRPQTKPLSQLFEEGGRQRSVGERMKLWMAKNSTTVLLSLYFGIGVAFYTTNEPW